MTSKILRGDGTPGTSSLDGTLPSGVGDLTSIPWPAGRAKMKLLHLE